MRRARGPPSAALRAGPSMPRALLAGVTGAAAYSVHHRRGTYSMDHTAPAGLTGLGVEFGKRLSALKQADASIPWYPYDSLSNLWHLDGLLPDGLKDALQGGDAGLRVLDIGAADGDLGYFFESRGCRVDFLDNPPTNFNDCRGLKAMAAALDSPSRLLEQDIDRAISLDGQYDLAIALGLLYHLRNPMLLMFELALHAKAMILSTRVAPEWPGGTRVDQHAGAYLYRCREANDDPTNYWCFTPKGLKTALRRCGWDVKTLALVGAGDDANPVDNDRDQRCFVYCERVPNWADLGKHHDF